MLHHYWPEKLKPADAQDLNSRRVDDTDCSSELTIKSLGDFRASLVI